MISFPFYSNIGIHSVEKIYILFNLLKYRYPLGGEDIASFSFYSNIGIH